MDQDQSKNEEPYPFSHEAQLKEKDEFLHECLKVQANMLAKRFRISRYINMAIAAVMSVPLTVVLLKGTGNATLAVFGSPAIIVFTAYVLDETLDPFLRNLLQKAQEKYDNDDRPDSN